MANLVKVKGSGIGIFLILLITSYLLFDKEENQTHKFRIWHPDSTLSQTDFKKLDPFFPSNGHAAQIVSYIAFNKYDDGTFVPITVIDRFKSWYNEYKHSEHLLAHEAYHANISSIGTKQLIKEVIENNLSYSEALFRRDEIHKKIAALQKKYDKETDHSLIVPMQHYWQYKIDSILNNDYNIENTDFFSGASAYFPSQPDIYVQKDTFLLYKFFVLDKNEMRFRFISKYDSREDTTGYLDYFVEFLKENRFTEIDAEETSWNGLFSFETECTDTINNRRFYDKIIVDGENSYQLTFFHSLQNEDSVYRLLKDRFFNSFQLQTQEDYWVDYINKNGINEMIDVTFEGKREENAETFVSLPYSDNAIIYHKPFIHDNKLILAFKAERHEPSDLDEVVLTLNESKVFTQEPDSLYQIIALDLKELSKTNTLQFGYLTKSDSVREFRHFYSTVISNYSAFNR